METGSEDTFHFFLIISIPIRYIFNALTLFRTKKNKKKILATAVFADSLVCLLADDGKLSFEEFKAYFADGILTTDELRELFYSIDGRQTKYTLQPSLTHTANSLHLPHCAQYKCKNSHFKVLSKGFLIIYCNIFTKLLF